MADFESVYAKAIEDKILPGYALLAGDKDGNVLYSGAEGVQSLAEGSTRPFQLDTICAIASMTKLMTVVAAVQCVQDDLVTLDEDLRRYLPDMGKYGIMTGFDDEKNEAILEPNNTPITLRMLLTHTSGHDYDFIHPLLKKWRASRGEAPFHGATLEEKFAVPLAYEPGTSFSYGGSIDWAGKLVEKLSGKTLEVFMKERIWGPLGIQDMTFFPKERPDMESRMATMNTLTEQNEGPVTHVPGFDIQFGTTGCLGGGGASGSAEAYFTFLQAVLKRDARLLNDASWTELLKPQLNERCKKELDRYLKSSPEHAQWAGLNLPTDIEKQWSLAGMVVEQGQEGRMNEGTTLWGGMPSMVWYLDFKAGICGVAFCQVMPPMSPTILRLHEQFQRAMYEKA